ncbi:MAG: hypothetical protein JXR70_13145 [Spirochaetales bacterium]|nr:hypothetical protein [Spirochaetales bacterium]
MKTDEGAASYYLSIRDEEFLELGNYLQTLKAQHINLSENKLDIFARLQQVANQCVKRLEQLERVRLALEKDMQRSCVSIPVADKSKELIQIIAEIQSHEQKNQLLVKEKMSTIGQNMNGFRKNAFIRPSTSVFNKIGKPTLIDLEQ